MPAGAAVAPHERAAANLPIEESEPLQLGIGAADRAGRDPEAIGQFAMRRHPGAWRQLPARNVLSERLGDSAVTRAAAAIEVRGPYCHGVNVLIDRIHLGQHYLQALRYCAPMLEDGNAVWHLPPDGASVRALGS